MKTRQLGAQGLISAPIGLGCMGMSQWYGQSHDGENTRALRAAYDAGYTMFDTAEAYGPFTNERLIATALSTVRNDITIATKFGFPMIGADGAIAPPNSRPDQIRRSVEGSLQRLRTDYIDLLYQHRLDPAVPVDEVVGTMAQLVEEGKVRYIGLCEVGAATIHRANAVHPLTAVQAEYSIWERNVEQTVLPTLTELGIGMVAFAPLGRGFLAGESRSAADFGADDFRQRDPRFTEENLNSNLVARSRLEAVAHELNVSLAQLCIAWVVKQGALPIPGTRRVHRVVENAAGAAVELTDAIVADINEIFTHVAGDRYEPEMMRYIDR